MLTKQKLLNQLKNVIDPELGISLVDLGLIYDVKVDKKGKAEVVMTLTTMGCPMYDYMEDMVKNELLKLKEVKTVGVELTFEPPWTPDKMSKEAKVKMGFFEK